MPRRRIAVGIQPVNDVNVQLVPKIRVVLPICVNRRVVNQLLDLLGEIQTLFVRILEVVVVTDGYKDVARRVSGYVCLYP